MTLQYYNIYAINSTIDLMYLMSESNEGGQNYKYMLKHVTYYILSLDFRPDILLEITNNYSNTVISS